MVETERRGTGTRDAAGLILAKFACLWLSRFVLAAWVLVARGFGPAWAVLVMTTPPIGIDLCLVLGGGIVVTTAAGRRRRLERDFDLAAVAWIPVWCVDIIGTLATSLLGLDGGVFGMALWVLALAWMAIALVVAVETARSRDE